MTMRLNYTKKILFLILLLWPGIQFAQKTNKAQETKRQAFSDSILQQVIAIEKERVLERAEKFLREKPRTVTAGSCPRSIGGKHDFYSEGPYWWPDPKNPDGPFIRHDGLRFPGQFQYNDDDLRYFSWIVGTYTSAYLLTGKEKYVKAAMEHLKAWFADTATLMNPNMLYAQAIRGGGEYRPGKQDVDHWDTQPDPCQFMLFAAIAGSNREWFELWKSLNLINYSEAGRLSQAVKNPLLWIDSFSNVFFGNKSEISNSADAPPVKSHQTTMLYIDNFDTGPSNWISKFEKPGNSKMTVADGLMDIISTSGATIWFNHKLSGNIEISYSIKVVNAGGKNDRVSDMNAFWMASDPANKNLFTRDGKFSSYDNLELYYAGVGGNNNSTTRFRKYHSDGEKPVLKEYTDKEHLLKGNKSYEVKIICHNGLVQYYRDNILYFDFRDKTPYTEGFFGIRTTKSHLQLGHFKVSQLQ